GPFPGRPDGRPRLTPRLPTRPDPTPEANPTPDRAAGGNLRAPFGAGPSVVVQDRADAAVLGEQGVAAESEQVEVERLVALPLAVALDFDGSGLRRLAGGEGQRAGLGDVVVVARCGGAVHGAERHRHRLIVSGRERDREGEQRRPTLPALGLGHVGDADAWLVVHDGANSLA